MTLIALIALAVAVVGLLGFSYAESRRFQVVHHTIDSPKVPESFEGAKIVFLTDIHAGPLLGHRRMAELVERANSLGPDVLLLGGDNVGGRGSGARIFYPAARSFRASLGKFAVLGNHDVWEGQSDARTGLNDAGFQLLENEAAPVERNGERIYIGGIDDLYTGMPNARAAAREATGSFSVLLAHNPDAFHEELPATRGAWDLALAGHTHGGQLTWFGAHGPIVPSKFGQRYRTGWRTEAGTPILVSNGVGTVTAPLRFFARPEIHVFELRRARKAAERPSKRSS